MPAHQLLTAQSEASADGDLRWPSALSVLAYMPVMVMYAPLKPWNVAVYMKDESVIGLPNDLVQFGLGHVCCDRN
jgi:hypothetical protein